MGGSIQAALLGRIQGRKALLYGAVLATLPDLDVFVPYPDPVSLMTYHRGFLPFPLRPDWLGGAAGCGGCAAAGPAAPYSAARRLFLTAVVGI